MMRILPQIPAVGDFFNYLKNAYCKNLENYLHTFLSYHREIQDINLPKRFLKYEFLMSTLNFLISLKF